MCSHDAAQAMVCHNLYIIYYIYICISITGGVVAVWLAVGVVPHVSQFLLLLLIFFPIRIAAAVLLVVRRGLELHVNCIIMFFVFYICLHAAKSLFLDTPQIDTDNHHPHRSVMELPLHSSVSKGKGSLPRDCSADTQGCP